ncbi:MAG TPA: hypothetical protein DDX39_06105, partial [Bacteroidales bacterium]|nr:hypothetical protein [Bacteroidales bacterium]
MKHLSLKTLSLIFVFISTLAVSQNNNFRTFSIEKGLSQSTIYSMIQDKNGYLWLGTDGGGVCVFDGKEFKVYNKRNGISGNIVRSLFQDKNQNIWLGTEEGITIYDGYTYTKIDTSKGFPQCTVLNIYQDKQSNIWAATDNGLVKLVLKNKEYIVSRIYTTEDGLETNFVFDIYEDDESKLWLAMYGGINILSFFENDSINISLLNKDNYLPSSIITSIKPDANGLFWIGTYDSGIFSLNPKNISRDNIQSYSTLNGLNDNTIWDIMLDNNHDIWFSTNNAGIYQIHNKIIVNYSEKQGLPSNQVLSLLQDSEQNIWLGTMGAGLVKHMGNHFSHYLLDDGMFKEQISDIEKDSSYYWLSTYGEGLFGVENFSDTSKIIRITTDNGLADNIVNDVFISKDNKLYISTQSGLSVYSDGKITNITEADGLPDNRINCTYIDSKGIIWIGTGAGLSIYNNDKYLNVTKESQYQIPNDDIQSIIEDKKGNVWIATLSGLLKFFEGQMTSFDEEEGLYEKAIHSLAVDQKGDVWIGTFGGGIYKLNVYALDSISIKQVANGDILSSVNVYSLQFLSNDILIVGTDKGFDKLYLSENSEITKVKSYNQTNGFIGVENKLNSILQDDFGNVWFGTIKGLTKYSPDLENEIKNTPQIHLSAIELFYEKVNWLDYADSVSPWFGIPQNLELPYNKNHLTFKFNAVSLSNPEKVKYRYMLEGLDESWSPIRQESEVVYSSLPAGNYTFKVIAVGENGIWTEKPMEFSFVINPPFWKTSWFIISLVILLFGLVYGVMKYRERQLKQEKAILEQKVEERTKEIAEKNKSLELANEEISAQRDEISHQKQELTDSIHYAQRIQKAVLPDNDFFNKHLPNHFVLFRPHSVVSGDFYWATKIGTRVLFTAADCTGHGVPGAFMSMLGMSFLNEIIANSKINTAGEVLDKLRENVITALRQKGIAGEQKDGMDMVLCILDLETRKLQFAGANNPLYLIRKTSDETISDDSIIRTEDNKMELTEIKPDKMPI